MPNVDAVTITTYQERKTAVLRAAELLSSAKASDDEREFDLLTEAIADFDIRQDAEAFVEIPAEFMRFLGRAH
ncbi:hypothetical protein DK26_01345 [Bosea sp. WAO]|uniref:hypothetical protein n=1 Tax=Bosea sp. WAO TaxID=406341 RepID=UPI0007467E9D|nr:hypothetical protein [Bosea sp. WAO]KUL97343.1 hypothetical protein DK26_01345 [Bosea sp. WAO]